MPGSYCYSGKGSEIEKIVSDGVLVATHGTLFFKESSREVLGSKFFKVQKDLKNFARQQGFGFITINPVEEGILPQVLNGGCNVSRIYSSQRMGAYDFWNTPRIKTQQLCHNCDSSCNGCHKAVALGSRKLAPKLQQDDDFQSEVGDLDWRDNQRPEEQENDYKSQIGDYGYDPVCEDDEEPSVKGLLAPGEKLDFIELERRMLEQDKIHQEASRKRQEQIRASHVPLAVMISRKEMGEILSPEEQKVLQEGLESVRKEADEALAFHQCGWFTSLRYPELNGKKHRCKLCAKWRAFGDETWSSRKTQDVSVMNANILIRSAEKVVSDTKLVLQGCRNILRSHYLDHLVAEFKHQVSTGIMPWEVNPKPFMWEDHMDRLKGQLTDLDSIGWFDTVQGIEELCINIFNSVSKTEKKDAVAQLVDFLWKYRAFKCLRNPEVKRDQKMISDWLDQQLSAYGLPYSDKFWRPPNKAAGKNKKFATPAVCMGCWLQRKGVC